MRAPPPGYLLLASPRAGGTDEAAIAAAAERLAAAAPTQRVDVRGHADLEAAIERLGERIPVVAGGDGSVHLVVAELRRRALPSARPLGLVPLGTGNDLARGLGVPLDPVRAADLVASGHAAGIDLLAAGDDIVCNAAHVGTGAEASRRAAGLKGALGRLAYPLAAALAGVRPSMPSSDVLVDGVCVHRGPALMVAVCNGPTIGGGAVLAPGARHDDGRLHVVVVRATGPIARASTARAMRRGRHVERPDVDVVAGVTARVCAAGPWNLDGEVIERTAPGLGFRVEAAALRVLVPVDR